MSQSTFGLLGRAAVSRDKAERKGGKMASQNVEKILLTLKDKPPLMLELSLVFARMEEVAGVNLTKDEKKELLVELSKSVGDEALVAWI